ncbi:MAG: hypothetical protein U9O55_03620 [Patescibacteria group bacterium]|nr:hypothetical protein [Patescibacteria group bacterium]
MITLNLLPSREKKQLNTKMYLSLATKIVTSFLWLAVIIFSLLFAFKCIMKHSLENMTKQNDIIVQNNKELNSEIEECNNRLSALSKIQNENIVFSKILIKITEIIPKKITLNNLSLQINEKEKSNKTILIKMKGFTNNRDNLIRFKNVLNSISYIKNIELPINTLLKQENIDFEISTELMHLDKIK